MHTDPEHEGQQVTDSAGQDPAPPFQAGHAGSIPVTRSKPLTSTNSGNRSGGAESTTSHFASTTLRASVAVE